MRYNAGSEVYTQALAHGLADEHEVHVFTRREDPFDADFAVSRERDRDDPRVALHVVNVPRERDRYRHPDITARFQELLDEVDPDVVHVGHLNHLSTTIPAAARDRAVPVVFTLHDYWLMCPRGQFIQTFPANDDLWTACDGQEDGKCAVRCYARYFSGADSETPEDVAYWSRWVGRRMAHVRELAEAVNLFVAPSRYLQRRFVQGFGLEPERIAYLDYGFDHARLSGRRRVPEHDVVFGYIGTHIPAKGIHHLLDAFGRLRGQPRLRIWGRDRGQETAALKEISRHLPGDAATRIEWRHEYRNQEIVPQVFDQVDVIVVPSIWAENSPLVIHEALQARVPVVTADYGGMSEYVGHEQNGLLYEFRNPISLAQQMQRLVDDGDLVVRLSRRGYLLAADGAVPSMSDHVREIVRLYQGVVDASPSSFVTESERRA
jgi:glycosyltransferase involved in cell wall biosynthesis